MGLTVQIKCPYCAYGASGRLGMGEEGMEIEYRNMAAKELAQEHPNHEHSSGWKFTKSDEWKEVEQVYYARYA
jgi:hypothetical protein